VIPDVDPAIMKSLLQFIYTGKVQVCIHKIVSMIKLVDYYCVKGAHEEFEKAALHYIEQASNSSEQHIEYVLLLM
jgi:hypothetical protein